MRPSVEQSHEQSSGREPDSALQRFSRRTPKERGRPQFFICSHCSNVSVERRLPSFNHRSTWTAQHSTARRSTSVSVVSALYCHQHCFAPAEATHTLEHACQHAQQHLPFVSIIIKTKIKNFTHAVQKEICLGRGLGLSLIHKSCSERTVMHGHMSTRHAPTRWVNPIEQHRDTIAWWLM